MTSRLLLCRRVLYRKATTAAQQKVCHLPTDRRLLLSALTARILVEAVTSRLLKTWNIDGDKNFEQLERNHFSILVLASNWNCRLATEALFIPVEFLWTLATLCSQIVSERKRIIVALDVISTIIISTAFLRRRVTEVQIVKV